MRTVIGRTLAILELLARSRSITPQEIAKATNLPVSTIYRYLSVLVEQGFARKEPGHYLVGRRLIAMQAGEKGHGEFASLVHEELEAFQTESGLTVFLCVREGAHALAVKVIESSHRLKLAMTVGDTLPLYASAPAKLLLAFADADFQTAYIATADLKRLASRTITEPRVQVEEIARIRARGYALSTSEVDEMASAVAFPVFDQDGIAILSLAISGPSPRFEGEAGEELIALTRKYASLISEKYARYQGAGQKSRHDGSRNADHHA
jgi:DNA-binding IclR family transcriptional regulator